MNESSLTAPSTTQLCNWVNDTRQLFLNLVEGLNDEQLRGSLIEAVRPPLWEVGHAAWGIDRRVLQEAFAEPSPRPQAEALFAHRATGKAERRRVELPAGEQAVSYLEEACDRSVARIQEQDLAPEQVAFILQALWHADIHAEAVLRARQLLGYPKPRIGDGSASPGGRLDGDLQIPGGAFLLGAPRDDPFASEIEKWAHLVEIEPFSISRAPVTQGEYAAFIGYGGYLSPEFWSDEGWQWLRRTGVEFPLAWRADADGWQRREFDRWTQLEPFRPVANVSWYEAEAYCRWAGRRLPTEAEWELAAAGQVTEPGGPDRAKRAYPWGSEAPNPSLANLDGWRLGCLDVAALPQGDSAFGCRQMLGNVWEWTSSPLLPYPGSPVNSGAGPWSTHRVLRGGSWATPVRLLRTTCRRHADPGRQDLLAGFRSCAV